MATSTARALSNGAYRPSQSGCSIAIALNESPVAINLDKQTRKRHVRRRT